MYIEFGENWTHLGALGSSTALILKAVVGVCKIKNHLRGGQYYVPMSVRYFQVRGNESSLPLKRGWIMVVLYYIDIGISHTRHGEKSAKLANILHNPGYEYICVYKLGTSPLNYKM